MLNAPDEADAPAAEGAAPGGPNIRQQVNS